MFDRFDPRARGICSAARDVALDLRQDALGTEHILLAIVDEGGAASLACADAGLTHERVFGAVDALTRPLGPTLSGQIPFMPGSKKLLEKTLDVALELGHVGLTPEHMLVGLLRATGGLPSIRRRENVSRKVLKQLDVDVAALEERVLSELRSLSNDD